MHLLKCVK